MNTTRILLERSGLKMKHFHEKFNISNQYFNKKLDKNNLNMDMLAYILFKCNATTGEIKQVAREYIQSQKHMKLFFIFHRNSEKVYIDFLNLMINHIKNYKGK